MTTNFRWRYKRSANGFDDNGLERLKTSQMINKFIRKIVSNKLRNIWYGKINIFELDKMLLAEQLALLGIESMILILYNQSHDNGQSKTIVYFLSI